MRPSLKTALLFMLPMLALGGPAPAARWKPVSINSERSIFIDMEAIARSGNIVQAWDWQKYAEPQSDAEFQGNYLWVKSLTNYHCLRRTTEAVMKIYFGGDGVEIRRAHLEGLKFPAVVEPDSLREKLLDLACNPPKLVAKAPATEAKPAETAAKPDAGAAKDKVAGNDKIAAGDKKDMKPEAEKPKADMEKKAEAEKAKAEGGKGKAEVAKNKEIEGAKVQLVAAPGKPRISMVNPPVYRRTYTLPPRTVARKKAPATSKVARAVAGKQSCPPQAGATSATQKGPSESPAQFTDAGNDGMFN